MKHKKYLRKQVEGEDGEARDSEEVIFFLEIYKYSRVFIFLQNIDELERVSCKVSIKKCLPVPK